MRISRSGRKRLAVTLAAVASASLAYLPSASAETLRVEEAKVESDPVAANVCGDQPWSGQIAFYPKTFGTRQNWVGRYCPQPGETQTALLSLGYHETGLQYLCIGPDQEVPIGWKVLTPDAVGEPRQTPPHDPGELLSHSGSVTPCMPQPPPGDRLVTISGVVQSRNSALPAENSRPFSDAKGEFWYFGRGGNESDPLQWRRIPGDVNLNDEGEFVATIQYPQDHLQSDGSTWFGCEQDENPEPFMESYACAHESMELRVYAESSDGMVIVKDWNSEPMLIDNVPVGHFFEEPDGLVTHFADSPAGHIYRSAYDVADVVPNVPNGFPRIVFEVYPETGLNRYSYYFQTISIDPVFAGGTIPRHEVGHALMHKLYGDDYYDIGGDCPDIHLWDEATNLGCAYSEGGAHFFAALADENMGLTPGHRQPHLNFFAEIERCVVHYNDVTSYCADGATVEGRVASALYDLADSGSGEENSFYEGADYSVDDLVAVMFEDKPLDIELFYDAWRRKHGDSVRPVMFLNSLEYSALLDEKDAEWYEGAWVTVGCATCFNGSFGYSDPAGDASSIGWRFDEFITQPGTYDVWLRLLSGEANSDPVAEVRIGTTQGERVVRVDQRAAASGWVNLTPDGVSGIDPGDVNYVRLVNTTAATLLTADAVLIAPHKF